MATSPQWWLFVGAALLMVLTPGPNMLYLLSRSLCQGRRAGMISLLGVVAGFLLHMLAAALGLTALFLAVPLAYAVLKWGGAAYLMWLAWQALWVVGLWLGAREQPLPRFPLWVVIPAAVYAAGMLLWRQAVGQDPMPGVPAVAMLLDKWTLGPLRVLNFASVFVLLVSFGPWLKQVLPRPLPLELLGRHSLSVFCAHIVIALFTLAFFGSTQVVRPWSTDVALLAGAFAGLFAVAMAVEARERGGRGLVPVWRSGPQVR